MNEPTDRVIGASSAVNRPRDLEPRLNKPTDSANGASSAGNRSQELEPRLNEPTDSANGASLAGSRSQDAPVRDLWGLALQKLSLEDKEAVSQIISDSKLDILQHLQTAAIKKRTECNDRRWKFELKGRQIILRDVAEKIVVWVDKFKQIGDIIVNFDPVHAALPWVGLRFLLEVGLMVPLRENHETEADAEADNRG